MVPQRNRFRESAARRLCAVARRAEGARDERADASSRQERLSSHVKRSFTFPTCNVSRLNDGPLRDGTHARHGGQLKAVTRLTHAHSDSHDPTQPPAACQACIEYTSRRRKGMVVGQDQRQWEGQETLPGALAFLPY